VGQVFVATEGEKFGARVKLCCKKIKSFPSLVQICDPPDLKVFRLAKKTEEQNDMDFFFSFLVCEGASSADLLLYASGRTFLFLFWSVTCGPPKTGVDFCEILKEIQCAPAQVAHAHMVFL
jgi:hypothetical protein